MSVESEKKFELSVKTLQGRWQHHPSGLLLSVRGTQVIFSSGEIYPLEQASKHEFECFGYVAQNELCSASEIVWKNPETSEIAKWHFEGDEDAAYEVDPGNILSGKRSRRSILDLQPPLLDLQPSGKKPRKDKNTENPENPPKPEKPPKTPKPDSNRKADKAEKQQKSYLAGVNKGIGNFKSWLRSVASRRHATSGEISGSFELPEISDPHVARRMEEFIEGHPGFSGKAEIGKVQISVSPEGLHKALTKYEIIVDRADELAEYLASETLEKHKLLEIFSELEEISVNVETLKRTLLGAKVNKYAKSEDTEISSPAKALVEKWKDVYRQEAMKSSSSA